MRFCFKTVEFFNALRGTLEKVTTLRSKRRWFLRLRTEKKVILFPDTKYLYGTLRCHRGRAGIYYGLCNKI